MKKFKYRLQQVLDYRQTVKEEAKRFLLLRRREQDDAEETMNGFQTELAQNGIGEGLIDSSMLELVERNTQRLLHSIEQQKEVIQECEKRVEEAQEAYIAASKDSKSLEIHKDKKQAEHAEYVRKEDEKFLDELNVQRSKRVQ